MSNLQDKYYVVNTLSINRGETGITYEILFCEYLEGAKEVEIREPYLRNNHQFGNLKKFIELLKEQEGNLRVDLITSQSTGRFTRDFTTDQQLESLHLLASDLENKGIIFNCEFDNSGHVRRITADNDKTIKSDRGLHIYREREAYNGEDDFFQRQCKPTEIDYIEPLELELANYILNDDVCERREPEGADMVREAENGQRSIIIDNITANDVMTRKIRVLRRNKHLFPQEIRGQRNSYVLPLLFQDEKHDFKYITSFTGDPPIRRSGIIRLGAELYDYIGIEEGTKLSIELRDDGVYVMHKLVGGENDHG